MWYGHSQAAATARWWAGGYAARLVGGVRGPHQEHTVGVLAWHATMRASSTTRWSQPLEGACIRRITSTRINAHEHASRQHSPQRYGYAWGKRGQTSQMQQIRWLKALYRFGMLAMTYSTGTSPNLNTTATIISAFRRTFGKGANTGSLWRPRR